MKFPNLFRRRELLWPTWAGWLSLSLAGIGFGVLVALSANAVLAPISPAASAKILVVEGWLSASEIEQALSRLHSGNYRSVITTGGPIPRQYGAEQTQSYAGLAANFLKARSDLKVVAVPAPASAQDRTYLSAVMVRRWAEQQGIRMDDFDVFSSGFHARRTRQLYRLAFGEGPAIGIISAEPEEYSTAQWWRSSTGIKMFIAETIGLGWILCCFWPAPPGSPAELWGIGDQ